MDYNHGLKMKAVRYNGTSASRSIDELFRHPEIAEAPENQRIFSVYQTMQIRVVAPLMFLGEQQFTIEVLEHLKNILTYRSTENPLTEEDRDYRDTYPTALKRLQWYLDRCMSGELPNKFESNKILGLTDDDLVWLGFPFLGGAPEYFETLRYVHDSLKGDLDQPTARHYQGRHANYLSRIASRMLAAPEPVSFLPNDLVEEATNWFKEQNRGQIPYEELMKQKAEIERKATQYILETKLIHKLR